MRGGFALCCARAVGQKPAPLDVLSGDINGRQSCACRQDVDMNNVAQHERVGDNVEGIGAVLEAVEGGRDVLGAPDCDREGPKVELGCGFLDPARFIEIHGIAVVDQDRKAAETGDGLAKEFESLGGQRFASHSRCLA